MAPKVSTDSGGGVGASLGRDADLENHENKDGLAMENRALAMDEPAEGDDPALALVPDPEEIRSGQATRADATGLARAKTLCQLQRFADAVPAVAAAITAEPRDPEAWCLMAEAQLGNDRPAAALQAAHAAASLAPTRERPRRLASLSLGRMGREQEAVEVAFEGTRCEPDSWQAHAQLAESLCVFRPRLDDARRAAEAAIALAPEAPGPHLAAGTVALAAGQRAEASSAFCAALAADPQCLEAHHRLAGVQALGPRRGASPVWRRALARIPRPGRRGR
jgi:tetratricopeptide (TPR) repeat protein